MDKQEIGIAVIGAGRAGMIHARNYARGIAGARLVAVVDPVGSVAEAAAGELHLDKFYTDYHQAIADSEVDAIVVVTPTKYHCEIVCAAARAGKHIFCEKPMAMTPEECQQMIEVTQQHGVQLQLGFMRRFDRNFMEAKAAIDAGMIGDVVLVKALTHGPSIPKAWMYDISISGGPLAEVSSHDIDAVRWFSGADFAEVYALAGNYRCPDAKDKFPDYYDTVTLSGRMTNGTQCIVEGAVSVGYGYDSRVEILGTDGILFVGDLQESSARYANRQQKQLITKTVNSWQTLFIKAYEEEDTAFIASIRSGSPVKASGNDGLEVVKVVNAGNLSITEKRVVTLNER